MRGMQKSSVDCISSIYTSLPFFAEPHRGSCRTTPLLTCGVIGLAPGLDKGGSHQLKGLCGCLERSRSHKGMEPVLEAL